MIRAGHITALYLFDIAEEIDLAAVAEVLQAQPTRARFEPKSYAPAYLQYQTAPILIDSPMLDLPEIAGCRPRVKVFDYGVISISLSRPFAGGWEELAAASARLGDIEQQVEDLSRTIWRKLAAALVKGRPPDLGEDYVIFAITELSERLTADELVTRHGRAIAAILRGERDPLSAQERDEVLRHRLSYLASDLIVPTWSTAFVYDTDAGVQEALEIFELANSQLLELRYYDDLLDRELSRIYNELERPHWPDWLGGRRSRRQADELHALFIDVNELTDKTENTLKMVGDVYAARLYTLVAARLGLAQWKRSLDEKLGTLDAIYRFTVEQVQLSRANLLELLIVLILVLELVLIFMGVME